MLDELQNSNQIFFYNLIHANLTHQWYVKGSKNCSYSHAGRGRDSHNVSLYSGACCVRGCKCHFIPSNRGQCNPHTSDNGATNIINLTAQRDARQYVCAVINLLYGKEHHLGILEPSEIQAGCRQL